ncbi:MAG TPA: energy transducer TonB [Vicinamibacterales bacterium]|nr:energy transducer TonB [Vicinamibacterales bacterium]
MRLHDLRRCCCDPGRFCLLAALIVAGGAAASAQELLELAGASGTSRPGPLERTPTPLSPEPQSPNGDLERVPPAPWGEGVLRATYLRKLPTKVKHVSPRFPAEALQPGTRATVVVETRIEADGRIVNARVIRSSPLFDQSVLDAVLQWEYTPTVVRGVAIPVLLTVTVQFTGS